MDNQRIAFWWGAALLLIGIAGLFIVGILRAPQYLGWLSHQVPIGLGLAFLFRSRWLLTAETAIGLIPESLWAIDLLGYLFTGSFPFGVTAYLFNPAEPLAVAWWGYSHLLLVPSMLGGLLLVGSARFRGALGALAHLAVIYAVPALFIAPDYNVNCVARSCIERFIPTTVHYALTWWVVSLLMIALVMALLQVFVIPRAKTK